jgi:hypothetical protein
VNEKAKPIARWLRTATGPLEIARLPKIELAIRLFAFARKGVIDKIGKRPILRKPQTLSKRRVRRLNDEKISYHF